MLFLILIVLRKEWNWWMKCFEAIIDRLLQYSRNDDHANLAFEHPDFMLHLHAASDYFATVI
jgi:hypothetical protein